MVKPGGDPSFIHTHTHTQRRGKSNQDERIHIKSCKKRGEWWEKEEEEEEGGRKVSTSILILRWHLSRWRSEWLYQSPDFNYQLLLIDG